jgi:hypothetical protein
MSTSLNISDPKNIVGIAELMDFGNGVSIAKLEKELISGGETIEEDDSAQIVDQFNRDIERINQTFDINGFAAPEEPVSDPFMDHSSFEKQETYQPVSYSAPAADTYAPSATYSRITAEQQKQSNVNSVVNDLTNGQPEEFDIEREKEEDDKTYLLEEIDTLRTTLEDEGIDIRSVPIITKDQSIEDIRNVHKILLLKNDRSRYSSMAEELIMAAVYGIEYLFDGKKEWFGRRPDLGGWSKTAKLKLRRCRYQTGNLVKEIMQDYNLSPAVRLALELVPSAFMYSRQKKDSREGSRDVSYDEAITNLNNV